MRGLKQCIFCVLAVGGFAILFYYTQLPVSHHVTGGAIDNGQELEDNSWSVSRADVAPIRPEIHSVSPATSSYNGTSAERYNAHCAIPNTDSDLPTCPFCNDPNFDAVSVYIEEFDRMNGYYGFNSFAKREKNYPGVCAMPNGIKCFLQHSDTMVDVVFRMRLFVSKNHPVRYCYPQIISMLNTEAEGPGYRDQPQVKHAEISIDYQLSSEVLIADACRMKSYHEAIKSWSPPDPNEHHGVAMFLSHCDIRWRYNFIGQLLKLVHIDMHGSCFHNVPGKADRFDGDYEASFIATVRKYRAVLVFENTNEKSYVTEKIFLAYSAKGVVPIYHGPPDAHMWLPGNHTYVDATKYKTPNDLANYIKRLLTNDSLYEYHTTNFDTQKVFNFLDRHCHYKDDYMCHLCRHAYKLKMDSFHNGSRHCNCQKQ